MNKEGSISSLYKMKSEHFFAIHLCRVMVISFLFSIAFSTSSFAQIYNYSPISYKDFETNPSFLATYSTKHNIEVGHQNSFNSNSVFSSTNLKYSTYFPSAFIGVGVSLNTTKIGNNVGVHDAGVGLAYRNVLFNKLYIKLGALYKLVGTNMGTGVYDYYSFFPDGLTPGNTIQHNLNTSLTINSDQDRFYISVGASNIQLPIGEPTSHANFPSYYTLHLGNLMSFFSRFRNAEASYTGFIKSYGSTLTYNHYATIKFRKQISRRSSIDFGSKIGLAENSFFHFVPTISYNRKKIKVNLSYNFRFDKSTFQPVYFQSLHTRLTFTL